MWMSVPRAWGFQKAQYPMNTIIPQPPSTKASWEGSVYHIERCLQQVIYKGLDFPKVVSAMRPHSQWGNLYFLNGCGEIMRREEWRAGHLGTLSGESAIWKAGEDYIRLARNTTSPLPDNGSHWLYGLSVGLDADWLDHHSRNSLNNPWMNKNQ